MAAARAEVPVTASVGLRAGFPFENPAVQERFARNSRATIGFPEPALAMVTQFDFDEGVPDPLPDVATADDEAAAEALRLESLDRYDVLDTPSEEAFDRIARIVRMFVQTPIALVSFIDAHRQWFKACEGLAGSEAPRETTICQHTIRQSGPLVIEDAASDPRFADHPSVAGPPHVRAYLGMPLRSRDGRNIGTICAVDMKPRQFEAAQIALVADLAAMVVDELELRNLASRDELTGAYARRAFKDELERATALAVRHHDPLTLIMFDLDHFKAVNDTYGHHAGDAVLAGIGKAAASELRHSDLFGRLGGEEFGLALPKTTLDGGLAVAKKLRSRFERDAIDVGAATPVRVTASFGLAALGPDVRDAENLLRQADRALYDAKEAGRNRCVAWQSPSASTVAGRRVLKAGQILFNGNTAVLDCTVRRLAKDGAGIDVSGTTAIPSEFLLSMKADRITHRCRVISRRLNHIDVDFLA
jgi:diguanylate cyclase (GGDEF)-like protein